MQSITILGIESSCDDTSAAVLRDGKVLSNCTANQAAHREYGGVVPELASRAHQVNIIPVIDLALQQADVQKEELSAIAFTQGPGLMGSLLVGVSFAKAMAMSLNVPMIAVNHTQGHVLAHFAEAPTPKFPFLCLTVSGGHTQIILVKDFLTMEIIGETIDDAAGEAFDKTGKLLGLGYPAGPIIDRLAATGSPVFEFATPKIEGLNFSFSGLKTSILYFLQKAVKQNPNFVAENLNDICASVQTAIVRFLMLKLTAAAEQTGVKEVAISGGVSANSALRAALTQTGIAKGWQTYIPRFEFCTDNAAMIAVTGYYQFLQGDFVGQEVAPLTRFRV